MTAGQNERLFPIATVTKNGRDFSILHVKDNKPVLRLYCSHGVKTMEVKLPIQTGDDPVAFGEWNKDGSIMWLSLIDKDGDKETPLILEIHFWDLSVHKIAAPSGVDAFYWLSLSPDEKRLAAVCGHMDKNSTSTDKKGLLKVNVAGSSGLCIVDLADKVERPVTVLMPQP